MSNRSSLEGRTLSEDIIDSPIQVQYQTMGGAHSKANLEVPAMFSKTMILGDMNKSSGLYLNLTHT
jgi:hypothetical protein